MRLVTTGLIALAAVVSLGTCRAGSGQATSNTGEALDTDLLAAAPSFAEEFESAASLQRWGYVYDKPGAAEYPLTKRTLYGNAERQIYVDPEYLSLGLDPFRIDDGILTITAAPLDEQATAAIMAELGNLPEHRENPVLRGLRYSSGLISQRGRFAQKYGYFEIRMRFSGGRGVWPAFWLLREDGRWPPEIDVAEILGHEPATIYSSIHSGVDPKHVTERVDLNLDREEFHTYGALWLPDRVDFFVDRRKTASIPTKSDMNLPMYPIVNLAIGGRWPGEPDGTTFPARLEVDYVRIWPLAAGS